MELKDFRRSIAPKPKPVIQKPTGLNVQRSPYAPVTRAPVVTTAPTVASTVNMVRPSFPVFTQSAPSAQPAPVNNSRGFTTAPPPAPPPNFFDPAGWQQSLYDKVLSKILPSKETLDNSNFSFLNLLNPSNKVTGKMIPEFIGNATLPGVAYNLAADAVKKFGLEDELAKYGPYAVAGGTAAGLVLNRNNPRGMAKITEGLTRGLVTNEIVKTISDITGVPWNAAAPTIFGAVNLNYPFRPPAPVPAGLSGNTSSRPALTGPVANTSSRLALTGPTGPTGPRPTLRNPNTGLPLTLGEVTEEQLDNYLRNLRGTISATPVPAQQGNGRLTAPAVIYAGTKPEWQRLKEIYEDKKNYLDLLKEETWTIARNEEEMNSHHELIERLFYDVEKAEYEWKQAAHTPEEIAILDAAQKARNFTNFMPQDSQQYLKSISQENEWKNELDKILRDRNLTQEDLINFMDNPNKKDRHKAQRELLFPEAISDHEKILSLISGSLGGLEDIAKMQNDFDRLRLELNSSKLRNLPGAPTHSVFDSSQNEYERFITKRIERYKWAQQFVGHNWWRQRDPQLVEEAQRVQNQLEEILKEIQSRPRQERVTNEVLSSGQHSEAANKLLAGRDKQISDLREFYTKPYSPELPGGNYKKAIEEERKRLVQNHPEMYVGQLGYLHNLDTNFYSRVNKFVEGLNIRKPMTGEEWKNLLYRDKLGLPQAELDYIGVKDDKKFDKEKLYTQQEMLDWLQKNGMKLKSTVYQQSGTHVSNKYNVNNIDTAIGTTSLLDDRVQMEINKMFPGGGPKKRHIQVIMVGEQGEQVLHPTKPRKEGHPQYNMINNPVGRLEFESMAIGKGDKTIWLHEVQGPKEPFASNAPSFLQYDNKGVNILLKRLLMLAYKNGYTSIQWTNGATQMLRRGGAEGLGRIYDEQLVKAMNKIIEKTGIKMGYRARPDNPGTGQHPWLDLTSPEMQKFLSEPMPIAKIIPQQGEEQRSIT